MDTKDEIDRLRRRIDDVDRQIVELLNERSRCALAIGLVKRGAGRPVYDPAREQAILRRASMNNRGPLQDEAIRRLFERILDESRRLERTAGQDPPEEPGKQKGRE